MSSPKGWTTSASAINSARREATLNLLTAGWNTFPKGIITLGTTLVAVSGCKLAVFMGTPVPIAVTTLFIAYSV